MDDQHSIEHGGADGHAPVHMPDPSIWPLLLGLAALACGLALVWWTRDRSNSFSGPALGAAFVFLLASVAGWAWQDGKMKRQAESLEHATTRDARYTQVVTFAIADGRLEPSQRPDGILGAIQANGSALRDLAGFQDLRIIASPADTGPSQVIVETTWSGRDGLATYEETRQTMLDFIADHPQDVVPGSAQIFDMQVVRDTKDMGFRFGVGPTVAMFGALIVGGFLVGAGLNLFHHESKTPPAATAPAGGGGGSQAANNVIIATDNKFDKSELTAPPNTKVTFIMENHGKVPHNLHFFTDSSASTTLADGAGSASSIIQGGQQETLTFTTPGPGTYYFHCDFHPDQMKGNLVVKEGAPVPGGGAASGGTAATGGGSAAAGGPIAVTATDDKFDKTQIDVKAGQDVEIDFKNDGKSPHNIHFYDKQGGQTLAPGAGSENDLVLGGKTLTLKFKAPAAGTYYYQCDFHPQQMEGKLVVS